MSRSPSSSSTSSDAFDELAAIFMTPADAVEDELRHEAANPTTTADAFIELLLVGHLPVRGNLWLTPYADALARDIGPVALIRLDGDHPTLEIQRGPDEWRSQIAGKSMREALECIASDIRGWVIRPQPSATGELPSPATIRAVDRLMLLSSADQAAAVAAYQLLKRVKHNADESGIDLPSVAMTIVGSPPESATMMVRRLQATAMSQLGESIELDRVLPRIDSEVSSSMYLRFTEESIKDAGDVAAVIDEAVAAARGRRERVADAAEPREPMRMRPSPITANGRSAADVTRDEIDALHAATEPDEPVRWDPVVRSGARNEVSAARADHGGSRIKLSPKPAAQRESKPADDGTDDADRPLAAHVAGLMPLEICSPRSEYVEIAVDARGGLHVLSREAHLRELRIVEAWATSHRELLAMAISDRAVDPHARITCHLFTSEPATVADLHGTGIKLHVLAPVVVEGRTGWYAAALSR